MTNEIGIVWTSDQRQLMADWAKRQVAMQKEIDLLKQVAKAGTDMGNKASSSYRDSTRELERLGRMAEQFKKVDFMAEHMARMKEFRVLMRMGKIDVQQFLEAYRGSFKQYQDESGITKRTADAKRAAAEQKALADQAFRESKAASDSLRLQKMTAIHEEQQAQKEAAASLRLQKMTAAHEERQQRKLVAEEVRRGLMSEKDLAMQVFLQRRRQLTELRNQFAISKDEFSRAMQKAREELRAVGAAGKEMGLRQAFEGALGPAGRLLTVAGATATAFETMRSEWENLKKSQKEALDANLTFAQAEEQAGQSLDQTLTPEELRSKIMDIATKRRMSPTVLMRQANQVLGVKDDRTTSREALDTMAELSEFTRLNPDDGAAIVSGVLGLKQAMPEASTKEIFGVIQQAKISSKVGKSADFAASIVPAMSAARAYGDSPQMVAGIGAAIGGQMQDVPGKRTSSAVIDLEKDLQILSSGVESGVLGGEKIKGGLGANTIERIQAIAFDERFKGLKERLLGENEDPEITELFKKQGRMTSESRSFGAIRLLYQGDKAAHDALNAKVAEQVSGKAAEAVVDRQAAGLVATPSQVTARLDSKMRAAAELSNLQNNGGAIAAMARERLPEVLRSRGVPQAAQTIAGVDYELRRATGGDSGKALQDALQSQIRKAEESADFYQRDSEMPAWALWSPFRSGEDAQRQAAGMSQQYRETATALREVLTDLKDAINNNQKNAAAPEINVNVVMPEQGKPGPPAAAGLQAK